MITIDRLFLKAYSPNEQLVMLQLLLHADCDGVVEFSDRGISKITQIPYQQVRTIHQKWIDNGTIANAGANAGANAKVVFVRVCEYESYDVFNKFSNAVTNAVTNALKEKEENKEKDKVSPLNPLQKDIENFQEREDNTPYNPPVGDGGLREKFNKLKDTVTALLDENKKLREEKENVQKKKQTTFVKPTVEEVSEYIREKGYHFDASTFVSFYESNGWMVGKNKMKNWKAACATWESKSGTTKKSYDIYDINHSADNRDPHKYDRTMELWGIK